MRVELAVPGSRSPGAVQARNTYHRWQATSPHRVARRSYDLSLSSLHSSPGYPSKAKLLARPRKTGAKAVLLDDSLAGVLVFRFIAQLKRNRIGAVVEILKTEVDTLRAGAELECIRVDTRAKRAETVRTV